MMNKEGRSKIEKRKTTFVRSHSTLATRHFSHYHRITYFPKISLFFTGPNFRLSSETARLSPMT